MDNDLTRWLRYACLRDPDFGDGVPWTFAPTKFARLREMGLVSQVDVSGLKISVANQNGREALEGIRQEKRRVKAERQAAK